MARPLLITDCDEVLLHFIGPFHSWCGEIHDVDFAFDAPEFFSSLKRKTCGSSLRKTEAWSIFSEFFDKEMHRQSMAAGASNILSTIAKNADVVVLTNLPHQYEAMRTEQLLTHNMPYKVYCNQGPKGPALARIIDEFKPSETLFVDDLSEHHQSVAELTPHVHRLHMVVEPRLAPHVPPAPQAHARIDNWTDALPWISNRLKITAV